MHLTEYACDEIAVRLTGCAFAWRLFTDLFSVEGMSLGETHPLINRRVRRAADLAKELGFTKQADAIVALLQSELQEVDYGSLQTDVPSAELKEISDALRARIGAVTADEMARLTQAHSPPLSPQAVSAALHSGRPVALDPWVVLCAVTPDQTVHSSSDLQEAVADSIRLGQVQRRFKGIAASSAPPPAER
jgi:hypothetical protein